MNKTLFCCAAMAAALVVPSAASAAEVVNGSATTNLLEPLAFISVEDVLFGAVVVPDSGSGTVTIDSAGGVPVYSNLTPVPSAPTRRGWFLGSGDPGDVAIVTATLPTALHLGGVTTNPSIPISLWFDQPQFPDQHWEYTVEAASHTFSIYVGGTLTVDSTTVPGTYSNSFEVTAAYP